MSQVAVPRRGAVPGLSQAWIALRNQKALFCVVSVLVFAGLSWPVLQAPREFHVLAEVPITAIAGDPESNADALIRRLIDPERTAAALATLERSDSEPSLQATASPDGKTVIIEARGSNPQRAGDLITALLRQEQSDSKATLLKSGQSALAKARKERDARHAAIAAAQSKLDAIARENTARNERNRKALAANTEAQRRQAQLASTRNRRVSDARSQARSHARSLEQALERRRYIGVRIDVLVDEIQGLRARLASTPETVTDVNVRTNAYGQELRLRLDNLIAEREDLVASRGASEPAVKEIDSRIRRMRQRVGAEPAETREESKRPNPERATVGSRLRAREAELAAITSERGEVLARIARLQSTPAPREPAAPPAPKPVAIAKLEPVLDAAPARQRLEAARKEHQTAEAEVQRLAQRLRDLQASGEMSLPSLQYPAPDPLDLRAFLIPLAAALLCGLTAVAIGEVRSRRPAAPAVRLRRRRTIEDRSRELIEGPPAADEPEPEPPVEVAPEPSPAPVAELAPQPAPTFRTPDTRPSPAPERSIPIPSPAQARETVPTLVPWPRTTEPMPLPDTRPSPVAERSIPAPPPAQARETAPTFIPRPRPTEPPPLEPLPVPDTRPASTPEMPVVAPPPAYLRATEPTFVNRARTSEPVPVPETTHVDAPEMKPGPPPLIEARIAAPVLVSAALSLEPPAVIPESFAAPVAEPSFVTPSPAVAQVVEPTLVPWTVGTEPAEAELLPPVTRTPARVRIVRKRRLEVATPAESQAVPIPEAFSQAPSPAPASVAAPTLVARTRDAVPSAAIVEAEPVRQWVELTPADVVPEEVVAEPEVESDLAREAVFSGQPVTVLEAPATIVIPEPVQPSVSPATRRRPAPRVKTRPRPLRELASLTQNANPLAVALDPTAAFRDTEALNRIREAIELAECRTVLVCGAHRGDGASHTALLLAAHLSERGWPIVLVDADFRYRSLHRSLRVPHLPGFSEFLMDLADYREVLQETEYERLAAVSAGPLLADPALLLEPLRVDRAIRILRELGALVIIDGGAALSEVQAELLAPFVDGTLLVSRHGKGGGWTLKKANERLHAAQANVLGLVRNPHRA